MTPLDGLTLPIEHCAEYDRIAEYCAMRGITGAIGEKLPNLLNPDGALKYIQADPEAFQERVKQCAYGLAMKGAR